MGDSRALGVLPAHNTRHGLQRHSTQSIVGDDEYAQSIRRLYPDYAEKPLSEQLEPIAVVGIGRLK